MNCPNCRCGLELIKFGQINVYHCQNCGGSFFEENIINRISLSDANKIAADRKVDYVSGLTKLCPKDNSSLKTIQEESIPQFVTLLKCEKCQGIFTFPDDLINLKRAQKNKLNFFKTWHLPLPSLRSVLVSSFIILTIVSSFYGISIINVRQSLQTQANEVVKSIKISSVNNDTVVYFITKNPFTSEAIFKDIQTGSTIKKIISAKPTTAHFLSVKDIIPSNKIILQVILTSGNIIINTDPIPFTVIP
jgi:Zn-finger nucleic acid-binding protein